MGSLEAFYFKNSNTVVSPGSIVLGAIEKWALCGGNYNFMFSFLFSSEYEARALISPFLSKIFLQL